MKISSLVLVTLLSQLQHAFSSVIYEDEEFSINGLESSCAFHVGARVRHLHEEEANDRALLAGSHGGSISSSHQRQEHRRAVSMNVPSTTTACDAISVDLPYDGIKMSFQRKAGARAADKPSSRFSHWSGTEANGSSFDFVKDDEGHLAGSVVDVVNNNVLQFRTNYRGDYEVTITASSDFAPEDDPLFDESEQLNDIELPKPYLGSNGGTRNLRSKTAALASSASSSVLAEIKENLAQQVESRKLYDDEGGNMDVLVVWTKRSECRNSGLSATCTVNDTTKANMEALVQLAITETNQGYANSGVESELLLVHMYRHETYDESQYSFGDSLTYVRSGSNGLDDVHAARTQYGADMVTLIINHSQYCGIAYLGPNINYMFAVTAWNCATGYYTFGHEIGHNLGCNHDKGTSNACSNSNYNYGYRDPQARFRTALAYNCASGQCDNNAGGGCTRVNYYSNPNTLYNGMAVGTPQIDNARRINDVKATVAGYYPHGATTPSPVPDTPAPTAAPVPITSAPTKAPVPITSAPTRTPSIATCGDGICNVEEGEGCGLCPADCNSPTHCNMVSHSGSSLVYSSSSYGIVFDVAIGMTDLYFYGLKIYPYGTTTAKVYMKSGSYSTDSDLNNWTKVFEGPISTASSRQDLEFDTRFLGESLSTVAFYISFASGGAFVYSRDGMSNGDATVLVGNTLREQTGETLPSTSFANRAFYEGIRYDYGVASTFAPTRTLVPSQAPSVPPPSSLKVSYYAVTLDSLPSGGLSSLAAYMTDTIPTIDYRAGSGNFATSGRSDSIAALFEGGLEFASGGESVTFCLTSDDGSKMMIDGALVINNDGLHSDRTVCETTTLAGRVDVAVEFFEKGGGATCVLEWERPSGSSRVVVPAGAWLEPNSSAPTLSPTASPTKSPTESPTASPTKSPTEAPTASPVASPTSSPTKSPFVSTLAPVGSPTSSCSCCEELRGKMDHMEDMLTMIHGMMVEGYSGTTSAPTEAPTTPCADRTDKWAIGTKNRTWCSWAKKVSSATAIEKRCRVFDLYADCPVTCGRCP